MKKLRPLALLLSMVLVGGCGERVPSAARQKLTSPDPKVRYQAAEEICWIEGADAAKLMLQSLKDSDRGVRMIAAESLARRGEREAIGPLIQMLRDRDMMARATAAQALGKLKAREAVRPLVDMLELTLANKPATYTTFDWGKDADAAVEALHKISGREFAFDVPAWRKWLDRSQERQ